jgi:hypothetical protein
VAENLTGFSIVLLSKNYHNREDFFAPQRHKVHKGFSLACGRAGFVPFVPLW